MTVNLQFLDNPTFVNGTGLYKSTGSQSKTTRRGPTECKCVHYYETKDGFTCQGNIHSPIITNIHLQSQHALGIANWYTVGISNVNVLVLFFSRHRRMRGIGNKRMPSGRNMSESKSILLL